MPAYQPEFLRCCPAFEQLSQPLCRHLLSLRDWPKVSEYGALCDLVEGCDADALPIFAEQPPPRVKAAGGYEAFVAERRCVPTRAQSWHDLFNALVWMHYPRFKWAINQVQRSEMGSSEVDVRNRRTLVQSRAAQFDEGGMVLLTSNLNWVAPLEHFAWREFFVQGRARFDRDVHCLIVGHALYESLQEPHLGITAKALPLLWPTADYQKDSWQARAAVDAALAAQLPAALRADSFLPLPLLGVPGWHPEQTEEFYANTRYFRSGRQQSPDLATS
ncbi:MAG TPA: DUF3025 domain-containing protein [Polyangiaceae bacterium]|nr:DUF3025 domain-containing protein [Polyangiaceae bacterium]